MNTILRVSTRSWASEFNRSFSVSSALSAEHSCKVLIIGGGSGGCTMAAKLTRKLKPKQSVIVLEPSSDHYYQALFTLIGAGVSKLESSWRSEQSVLPKKAKWLKDHAEKIFPDECYVTTRNGDKINYEYLIVAVGLENDYSAIKNLKECLDEPKSRVSSIFSHLYCNKVYSDLQTLSAGNAIYTYPDSLIKCPGAPQKIAYLSDSYLNQTSRRHKVNMYYNTCLPVLFGVKKYADALHKVAARKEININLRHVLKEINPDRMEAVFYDAAKETTVTMQYSILHVTPSMKVPRFLSQATSLVDERGQLQVDKYTLQHDTYKNIFGIGDCTSTPNSKTAAAIAKQSYVLEHNLLSLLSPAPPAPRRYDGYGACPLVTEFGRCILAEFLYDGEVHETLPWNQAKESRIAYYMKKDFFPFLYWNFMLKGYYNGPEFARRILNPFKL